jgi:hypothetical protein
VISTAGFADTLDIRDFESLRPRNHGRSAWWFESARRLQQDAAAIRGWMKKRGIVEADVELWADDPIHFYVSFSRGVLRKSRHVKIPHCFNLEDDTIPEFKRKLEAEWRATPWPKKFILQPWQRRMSGVDLRMDRVVYDRAYSFDRPSCWAETNVDVSGLISIAAFEKTYQSLPAETRAEVEAILAPIRAGRRPLVLLLLFGLGPELRRLYEIAMARIFSERASEWKDCSLAVKVHPAARGIEEQVFIDWLKSNVPAQVHPISHALNLEFMLPQLQPDYVLAGLCGALPIVTRLQVGHAVALSELIDAYLQDHPDERQATRKFLRGIEVW